MDPPQTPPPPNFSQKPKFHFFFFLKPSLRLLIGTYGHLSEGFILAEFYLLRASIQNLGQWLSCDLALQANFIYV